MIKTGLPLRMLGVLGDEWDIEVYFVWQENVWKRKATLASGFLGNRLYGDEHKTKFLNYLSGFLNHWEVMYSYKITVYLEKYKRF